MEKHDTRSESEHLVQLVNIVFGVVLASGLTLYQSVETNPSAASNRVPLLALLDIYLTSVMSWVGWHRALGSRGYRQATSDTWRFATDLAIVLVYAYVLFAIRPFVCRPDAVSCLKPGATLTPYLLGYPFMFGLYLIWGILRATTLGSNGKYVAPIVPFVILFLLTLIAYVLWQPGSPVHRVSFNESFLVAVLVLTFLYRWAESRFGEPGPDP